MLNFDSLCLILAVELKFFQVVIGSTQNNICRDMCVYICTYTTLSP